MSKLKQFHFLYPAITAAVAFAAFAVIYALIIFAAPQPEYLMGLIFALPFLIFALIALLSYKEKLKPTASTVITSILIPVLLISSWFYLIFFYIKEATKTITDVSGYERVLKVNGYSKNKLISFFPAKIPADARDIYFSYNPPFLQGGCHYILSYTTENSSDLSVSKQKLANEAIWTGTYSQAMSERNELQFLFSGDELTEDFTIYLIYSRPYRGYWNHGEISAAAISEEQNKIIFKCSDW